MRVRFLKKHKFSEDGINVTSAKEGEELDVSDEVGDKLLGKEIVVDAEAYAAAGSPDLGGNDDPEGDGQPDQDEPEGHEDALADAEADATEAANTEDAGGNENPAAADDGNELKDDESDEGWPGEGKGKDAAPEDKAEKPSTNK